MGQGAPAAQGRWACQGLHVKCGAGPAREVPAACLAPACRYPSLGLRSAPPAVHVQPWESGSVAETSIEPSMLMACELCSQGEVEAAQRDSEAQASQATRLREEVDLLRKQVGRAATRPGSNLVTCVQRALAGLGHLPWLCARPSLLSDLGVVGCQCLGLLEFVP